MSDPRFEPIGWERTLHAVQKVKDRLRRAADALENAGVPYAVIGGHAVAEWVSRIDDGAVRNTPDVDILIRRQNFEAAKCALEAAGFVHRIIDGMVAFLDGPNASPRAAVHILFAGELVRPDSEYVAPDVTESESAVHSRFCVISLQAIVRMKLVSFRLKDRVHIRDMLDVELIDPSWVMKLPAELAARLQTILDTPEG